MKGIGGDVGAGHTLGRYELLVPIARGGMAVVWAARMTGSRGFQKLVAIKSMLPSLTDDDGTFEEMFMAEAQLAAQIRHPNVCEILDLGEQDGVLFIVMEWVDGEPLGTIHKVARDSGAGIPIAITTRIGLAVTQGLHAAHELKNQETGESYGLVHRDVSPQNILITHDGVVKIVDFGVAKATSGLAMQKTAVGQMKGKVTYMAPEQARGEPIDRRADVFALGIVLYQLVTNRHPFKGDTPLKTLDKICDAKPVVPPITYTPTCHPALSAAITKALEKDPKKRFSTMAEFGQALEGVLSKMVTRGNDLAPFVKQHVGDRNEKRRELIREALRTADERKEKGAGGRSNVESASGLKRALAAPTAGVAAIDESGRTPGASSISSPAPQPTPPAPPKPPRRSVDASRLPADTLDEVQSERPNIDFDDTTVDAPNPSSDRSAAAALADSSTVEKSSEPSRPVAAAVAAAAERTPPPKNVASEAPKPKPTSSPPKTRTPSVPAPPASEPRRGRGWIVGALLVLVVALGVVAFTVPGALDRTPWKLAAHPNPVPTASASASATASAATATSAAASAEPSASADASASAAAEAPEAPTASASASASGSAAPRPGAARGYVRPAPAPKGTTSATYENPGF